MINPDHRERPFLPVQSPVSFPLQEEEILEFWEKNHIFQKTLKKRRDDQSYSFYDGPPFATGLPHYGHILAGVLKDIIPRYWTMKGYHVQRRFGWDCHGLPIEHEINRAYQIENRKQVLAMGIERYNSACRSIVKRYSSEWKKTVRRIGRWVDMDHAYFTMDIHFMQSVWWVFKELWQKGLIYEGYKVVPYSTGLSTPLSNFESHLNYQFVQDPAITVTFPLVDDPNTFLLAWTTTPWTLPSNLALAIGKSIEYVKVQDTSSGRYYVLARALLDRYFKTSQIKTDKVCPLSVDDFIGRRYQPLFPFFKNLENQGAFRIIHADHVHIETGTGIVHLAPAFGEEDYFACQKEGLPLVNPIDEDGVFTAEVPPYQGCTVKEADPRVIQDLKKSGRLFKQETIDHSYPFCYRTHRPLIYRAVSSWFVSVEKLKDKLIENNKTTTWVPEHLKERRFGNWLENARDWAISRNRFWGTPLPIWKNQENEIVCIGSKNELEQLSGIKVTDLHMDQVDSICIPSPTGKSPLRRVEGVLDCWFESGSMPYAQWGYPYDHQLDFKKNFPADFIAEGLDQTRGWFYTLLVIGTGIFNKSPFKNVIVNGLILAEDGKKMSKSLKNYPDPLEVLNRHGADALRLYLIHSPVVKAQELRFSETGVKDMVRKILLRWWNAYAFFVSYANIDFFLPQGDFKQSKNPLDQWILSRLHTLIELTQNEMDRYRLDHVVPSLLKFIEDLTNTYIRLNRKHFWQEGMPEDKRLAYETLYETLLTLSRLMAPFTPFLSETIYKNLARIHPSLSESVHLEPFPMLDKQLKKPQLEESICVLEELIVLGRHFRETIGVKAKIPLQSMTVINRNQETLDQLKSFEIYFKEELNIKNIQYTHHEDQFLILSAKANFSVLGSKIGPKMKKISQEIQKLTLEEMIKLETEQFIILQGERLTKEDIEIRKTPKPGHSSVLTGKLVSIEMNSEITKTQKQEGLARELVRKIQLARKKAKLNLEDRIKIEINGSSHLRESIEIHLKMIQADTLCVQLDWTHTPQGSHCETIEIDQESVYLGLRVDTPL